MQITLANGFEACTITTNRKAMLTHDNTDSDTTSPQERCWTTVLKINIEYSLTDLFIYKFPWFSIQHNCLKTDSDGKWSNYFTKTKKHTIKGNCHKKMLSQQKMMWTETSTQIYKWKKSATAFLYHCQHKKSRNNDVQFAKRKKTLIKRHKFTLVVRMHPSTADSMKNTPPTKSTFWNAWPRRGLKTKHATHFSVNKKSNAQMIYIDHINRCCQILFKSYQTSIADK